MTAGGEVTALEREDIEYVTDPLYPDGRYFSPEGLWTQISAMARKVIAKSPHITLIGITSTSQRQGIVRTIPCLWLVEVIPINVI